ncbi:hypothetical protein JRO89_XS10G0166900 [Xanthoceras sorbifolium]|uniref:Uncharacterized protein n=1 Tax=Xanthoceras sorbifolium TaxID=99658 RepID=A0ABQ8HJ85_9ROSI|nr:hypothetical protein JRO89_XS10G0166900 [Xanthoceras sorbifolium]
MRFLALALVLFMTIVAAKASKVVDHNKDEWHSGRRGLVDNNEENAEDGYPTSEGNVYPPENVFVRNIEALIYGLDR